MHKVLTFFTRSIDGGAVKASATVKQVRGALGGDGAGAVAPELVGVAAPMHASG